MESQKPETRPLNAQTISRDQVILGAETQKSVHQVNSFICTSTSVRPTRSLRPRNWFKQVGIVIKKES